MNVSLTPELEKYVNAKVKSGLYQSASEVIRDGLRLLRENDEVQRFRLERLKKEIAIGLEQLEKGQYKTHDDDGLTGLIEEVKAEGRKRLAKRPRRNGR